MMNFSKKQIVLILIGLSYMVFSCKSAKKPLPKEKPQPSRTEAGKIITKLSCENDPSQSFALYLPKDYYIQKKWPVLYCFDAHARGALPVKRYSPLAEKYGYLLIGSNAIKNGQSGREQQRLINLLFRDTATRFHLNPLRKYVLGFSGGARTAVLTAMQHADIKGVIGCAAGFPSNRQPLQRRFDYMGMVGRSDFNYWEMIQLNRALDKTPLRHVLLLFEGKHGWPEPEVMDKGFLWLEFNAMRDGQVLRESESVDNFADRERKKIEEWKKKRLWDEAGREERLAIAFLEGLSDVSGFEQDLNTLLHSPAYLRAVKRDNELQQAEFTSRQTFQSAFSAKSLSWWKGQVKRLHSHTADFQSNRMHRRLLAFLSLYCYLSGEQALKKHQLKAAGCYLDVYKLVDASNADRYYLSAWLDILRGERERAVESLLQSFKLGIDEQQKIWQIPQLRPLLSDARLRVYLRN